MKKLLLLTCLLAFAANFLFAANEAIKPEGEGTVESPYLLTKVENLVWMGENISECGASVFRLENDIDASETRNWVNKFDNQSNGNFGFISIGDKLLSKDGIEHEFSGLFDGQNFAIKNLFASSLFNSGCAALFSDLAGARVTNLKLININLGMNENSSLLLIGSLAKSIKESTVTNVHATGRLSGRLVGGIAASAKNSKFSNCSFVGKINGFNNGVLAGGLIGDCVDCEFVCCRTSGTAFSSAEKSVTLGGLFGRINYGTTDVLYCYSDMHLIAKGSSGYVGGLVGVNGMSNYEDYYGDVTIGDFGFKQCYSNCDIEMSSGIVSRGMAGWFENCVCFDCYYNSDLASGTGFGKGVNSTKIKQRSTFSNWNFGKIWEINEGYTTPFFVTESGSYLKPALIGDWFGVIKIQPEKDGYGYGETVTVTALPYEGAEFVNYNDALEGKEARQTLTIEENVTIEANFAKQISTIDMFATIGATTPRDQNYVQTADFDLSGVVFTNCIENLSGIYDGRNHSILNWKNYGLFGEINNALVCNLRIVDAEADRLQGGILVSNYASDSVISNCYVSACVNNCRDNSGAICGAARNSVITRCAFIGEFNGGSSFGGLCDVTRDSVIDQCSVEIYSEDRFINCFCGSLSPNTKLVNCYAKGKFSGQFGYTGMSASNCYLCAEGDIRLGISDVANFHNCYFSSNCVVVVEGVAGLVSPEEMKKQETYAGWDFENIWDIDEGVGTPYFRYALPEPAGMFALLLLALVAMKKR